MSNRVISLSDEQSRVNSLANDLVQKLNAVISQLDQGQQNSVAQADLQEAELMRQQSQQQMTIEEVNRQARNVSELNAREEQRTLKILELDRQAQWLKTRRIESTVREPLSMVRTTHFGHRCLINTVIHLGGGMAVDEVRRRI